MPILIFLGDFPASSMTKLWLCLLIVMICNKAFCQNSEYNGWLFYSHQQKLSKKWQFSSDLQIRTAHQARYLNTLLIRPGIGYNINVKQMVTVGYTYFGSWENEIENKAYEPENRIFEQYQIESDVGKLDITNRLRFEQRFIGQKSDRIFAQRLRYYVQFRLPILSDPLFTRGLYATVQNEFFLNVPGSNKAGKNWFSQNRSYAGIGYRYSDKLDVETGYMFRYMIEEEIDIRNNILQISIKSSL